MRATSAMFSSFQMPPPSPMRLVIHVISIPSFRSLRRAKPTLQPALDARSPAWRCSASVNRDPARSQLVIFILRDGVGRLGPEFYPAAEALAPTGPATFEPASPATQSRSVRSPDITRSFQKDI